MIRVKQDFWAVAVVLLFSVQSAYGGLIQIGDPGAGFFGNTINFDKDPFGNAIGDDVPLFNQYQSIGVRFRDELSLFSTASGGSPGDADDDEFLSSPNSAEVDDDDGPFYFLFEVPALDFGAFVLADDDDGGGTISLEAFDTSLASLGSVSISADENMWRFIGFTSDMEIAAVKFHSSSYDDHSSSDDDDDFNIDNAGVNTVPEPSSLSLVVIGVVSLLGSLRRRKCKS